MALSRATRTRPINRLSNLVVNVDVRERYRDRGRGVFEPVRFSDTKTNREWFDCRELGRTKGRTINPCVGASCGMQRGGKHNVVTTVSNQFAVGIFSVDGATASSVDVKSALCANGREFFSDFGEGLFPLGVVFLAVKIPNHKAGTGASGNASDPVCTELQRRLEHIVCLFVCRPIGLKGLPAGIAEWDFPTHGEDGPSPRMVNQRFLAQ